MCFKGLLLYRCRNRRVSKSVLAQLSFLLCLFFLSFVNAPRFCRSPLLILISSLLLTDETRLDLEIKAAINLQTSDGDQIDA